MEISASPEEVREILEKYKSTIMLESDSGQIMIEGIPVIFARSEFISNIYSELENMVGQSASGVMKGIGKAYGEKFYELLKVHSKDIVQDRIKVCQHVCAETEAIGWGKVALELSENNITITSSRGLASGKNYKGISQQPVDSYFLGYFEGLFSKLDGIQYYGAETKCVAMGDEVCRLELGTEPVF